MVDSVAVSTLSPVPTQQPIFQDQGGQAQSQEGNAQFQRNRPGMLGKFFSVPWIQWFTELREKVNVINSVLVSIGAASGDGIVVSDNTTGTATTRSIAGTAGEINVANGDGVGGNPTISIIATGITPGTYHGITFDADGRATAVNVVYTVATLPAGAAGNTAFVTDSTVAIAAGLGAAPVGGGANGVPVFHDGAGWKIG